jgi:hypothetical protein
MWRAGTKGSVSALQFLLKSGDRGVAPIACGVTIAFDAVVGLRGRWVPSGHCCDLLRAICGLKVLSGPICLPPPIIREVGGKSASGALKDGMRQIIIALAMAALPTCVAVAEQPASLPMPQPAPQPRTPSPRQATGNPCAAFGPNFVKVEGSSTCVKVGGTVRVEGGGSR